MDWELAVVQEMWGSVNMSLCPNLSISKHGKKQILGYPFIRQMDKLVKLVGWWVQFSTTIISMKLRYNKQNSGCHLVMYIYIHISLSIYIYSIMLATLVLHLRRHRFEGQYLRPLESRGV